ncbi:hypothetical protein VFPPC_17818 [Pochonia chlamydosporia 170]|uniref:Uncharacterized protein n=1 Tax=Pochonia chlamydosporia 170 TaxID=1380566 RepID=A0A219AQV3_METCM|nr:hypothetical protein VFPPC_17818 [Pochonia chlamydosporia 170]OWT42989.1 hypothetical protein VFPPC_17818 [Pochonia chlamydosporia 170]
MIVVSGGGLFPSFRCWLDCNAGKVSIHPLKRLRTQGNSSATTPYAQEKLPAPMAPLVASRRAISSKPMRLRRVS